MSGHSKWSTIKRKKGAIDAKRSKIFSKIIKEIVVAVKEGGKDPEGNPRLRLALTNARGANMPKDNIQRAISKAEKDAGSFSSITYEGYAPNGIAVIVECLTDNNNRTVSNIRAIFNKKGGSLGTTGSLNFLFERKGVISIPKANLNLEEYELDIIDAGADDIQEEEDFYVITTSLEGFSKVQKKLDELKIEVENSELRRIPHETKIIDVESAKKVMKIIEDFEDDDDVQNVFHNLEITEEIAIAMGSD
jgi:YebC/PmpR family DNA-binding regulatory protein